MRFSLLVLVCALVAFALAQTSSCSYNSPAGFVYDLNPATPTADLVGVSDGTPYTYYFSPCKNTQKCTSPTAPPSPSPVCQVSTSMPATYGLGNLNQFTQGDLSPLGSGFWIQYTGGDRTAFGSRAVNVSCICSPTAPSNPVSPTSGTYENPSTPASYQLTFVSPYCCPAQPQPVSVNATCRVCEYAVSAVRLELAYHPTSSQSALLQYLQPLCNVTVPTLSADALAQCQSVLQSYGKEIVVLASDSVVNPNAICVALDLCCSSNDQLKKLAHRKN